MSSNFEDAYRKVRKVVHRVRYCEKTIVEKRIHAEALTVRNPETGETIARGARILIRNYDVPEAPPAPYGPPASSSIRQPDQEWPEEWLDPRQEGQSYPASAEVLIDVDEIPTLLTALEEFGSTAMRWERNEVYSNAEDFEAVYAWNEALVIRLIKRGIKMQAAIESTGPPRVSFRVDPSALVRLRAFFKEAKDKLASAP